jgi:hypothetical protein
MPDSVSEVTECKEAYRIAGLPGCIGSSDATHVPLKKVSHSFVMLTLDSNPKPQQEHTILL